MKLGTFCLRLKSGNHFYYSDEGDFAEAFVKGFNREFLGGFLCRTANRKMRIFMGHEDTILFEIPRSLYLKTKESLNVEPFLEGLGGAAYIFKDHFFKDVADQPASRDANACSERQTYYEAAGCPELYNSQKAYTLGMLLANHVSVFTRKRFRETFVREKEARSELRIKNFRKASSGRFHSYGVTEFKAPAWYLMNLVNELSAFNSGASVSP
jgi:hypothetical protein